MTDCPVCKKSGLNFVKRMTMGDGVKYDRWDCHYCKGIWLPICPKCNLSRYYGQDGVRIICIRCDGQGETVQSEGPLEDSSETSIDWFHRIMNI